MYIECFVPGSCGVFAHANGVAYQGRVCLLRFPPCDAAAAA